MQDIRTATRNYETWLAQFCPLYVPDLHYKHQRMADAEDAFPFFRGTYYRWAELWPGTCPELNRAPRVLAVGDLHIENFGTWRDTEGRIAWGVNDFDETAELPYTHDLVRLAASLRIARHAGTLEFKFHEGCAAILRGYRESLARDGAPFVLEERHAELRSLAMEDERDPKQFWKKLTALLNDKAVKPPQDARRILLKNLPKPGMKCAFRRRPRVGMGSLGKPRFVALAEWNGGWVAREVKALTPPATAAGQPKPKPHVAHIVRHGVRCPDPFYRADKGWIVRRLAPRCSRIELVNLAKVSDQFILLEAMGGETANLHLGTKGARSALLADLKKRGNDWLEEGAKAMSKMLEADWQVWCAAASGNDGRDFGATGGLRILVWGRT